MKYIKPIPTNYGGAGMRSLLEAKWAAFFDVLDWHWFYEPIEFDGWIPDFVLIGAKQQTFVEVKPVFVFPEDVAAKINASGCSDEVLIVGMVPVLASGQFGCGPMGWLRETETGNFWWDAAYFHGGGVPREDLLPSGFHHATGSWSNRISGFYDGDHGSFYDQEQRIMRAWHTGASTVQWRPNWIKT